MYAFNRNNDKLREEIILIGFQVRPKGRTGQNSPNIQKHKIFTFIYANMINENVLVLVLGKKREVEERTVDLRKWLETLVPGGEVFSDMRGDKN